MTTVRSGLSESKARNRNNIKETTEGVQRKDDDINFGNGLGNGKNGFTLATPISRITSDMCFSHTSLQVRKKEARAEGQPIRGLQ